MRDLVLVLRRLWKTPGFTLLAVLILAVGIGATTSILTLITAALLKSLPYRDAATLVSVTAIDRSGSDTSGCLSYPHFQLLASRSRAFSSIAAFTNETFSFSANGEPIELAAARVSANFLAILGVNPFIGRGFMAEEGGAGGRPVVLISEGLWRRRFQANPHVVGQVIGLDSKAHTVVGVLPASFQFGLLGTQIDVWTPRIDELNLATPQGIQGGTCYLDGIARLAPGVSIEQARAEMRVLDRQYVRNFPKMGDADPNRPVEAAPLKAKFVGNFQSIFLMLTAAVALVLLVACANVAGLLLTRAFQRRREIAIRIAMGARRTAVMMQFLMESTILALLGGIAGVLLSVIAAHELVRGVAQTFPRIAELPLGVDWSGLAFAFGLSMLSGLLSGLAPALQLSGASASAGLREEGRGTAGTRSRNLSRNVLVAGQIALSLILLVGAGLLIRSFILLASQSPGFNAENVLTMNVACRHRNIRGQTR